MIRNVVHKCNAERNFKIVIDSNEIKGNKKKLWTFFTFLPFAGFAANGPSLKRKYQSNFKYFWLSSILFISSIRRGSIDNLKVCRACKIEKRFRNFNIR